tara:strand:+ start:721 stop:1068 length:348 start_codon:yes stop_codon:yes gene_type:complete
LTSPDIKAFVIDKLEGMKANHIESLDVSKLTSITDTMIIASGTSTRHVKSIANYLVEEAKAAGMSVLGVEGQDGSEWVLVDMTDVIVHVMLPQSREFYQLEKLWDAKLVNQAHEN